MRSRWMLLLTATMLAPCAQAVDAADPTVVAPRTNAEIYRDKAIEFGQARLRDARSLVVGPERPIVASAAGLDCRELYTRRVALTRERLDYTDTFWDDPRNRAAVFLGAAWTPVFYFLGYTALSEYKDGMPRPQTQADIDALRAASAQLRCFER